MAAAFIDANVPLYAAGPTHPRRGECLRVFQRIRAGYPAITSAEVHQEILYVYLRRRQPERAREISAAFQQLVSAVLPIKLEDVALARELSITYSHIGSRDLLHLAVMLNNGLDTIVSSDSHFDHVREIRRLDPASL